MSEKPLEKVSASSRSSPLVGLSAVSIPVTIALVLSATGADRRSSSGPAPTPAHRAREPGQGDHAGAQVHRRRRATTRSRSTTGPTRRRPSGWSARCRQAGAVATFFDVGERADAHPDLVELQRTVGQVANHSYTHAHLPKISQERRFQELTETAKVLDHPNAFVRPPFGETSPDSGRGHAQDRAGAGLLDDRHLRLAAAAGRRHRQARARGAARRASSSCTTVARTRSWPSRGIVSELRSRGMCPGLLAKTDKTVVSAYQRDDVPRRRGQPEERQRSRRPADEREARKPPENAEDHPARPRPQRGGGDRRDDGVRRGSDHAARPPHRHLRQLHGRDAVGSRASRPGWEVWETVGNTGKKGGALNQAWDRLSDDLDRRRLHRHHGRGHAARRALRRERVREVPAEAAAKGHRLGGVCANFHGLELDSALGVLQKMEYARAEKINRSRRGRRSRARRRGHDVLGPRAARGL